MDVVDLGVELRDRDVVKLNTSDGMVVRYLTLRISAKSLLEPTKAESTPT